MVIQYMITLNNQKNSKNSKKLEKTKTEPWDQWAFDIAPDPSYKFDGWTPKVVA